MLTLRATPCDCLQGNPVLAIGQHQWTPLSSIIELLSR
jgi:hypothetical protein